MFLALIGGCSYDQIDVEAAKAKGIYVSNTPGAVDEATATTALYLTLSALRRYSFCERNLHKGGWVPDNVCGVAHDVSTRTIGILGLASAQLSYPHFSNHHFLRMGGIGSYYAKSVVVLETCAHCYSVYSSVLCTRSLGSESSITTVILIRMHQNGPNMSRILSSSSKPPMSSACIVL